MRASNGVISILFLLLHLHVRLDDHLLGAFDVVEVVVLDVLIGVELPEVPEQFSRF